MELMFKIPVLALLAFIVFSLGQGMYYMAKDGGSGGKTQYIQALTVRVVLLHDPIELLLLGTCWAS